MQSNVYLDGSKLPEGVLKPEGEELSRIIFPQIKTLFSEIKAATNPIEMIQSTSKNTTKLETRGIPQFGINLNLGILGKSNVAKQIVSPSNLKIAIPTNIRNDTLTVPSKVEDLYDKVDFISGERHGGKNKVYNLDDLKKIAKMLGVLDKGTKAVLAQNIKDKIKRLKGES